MRMLRAVLGLCLLPASGVLAASHAFLAPFWGGDLSPLDTGAVGAAFQLDQFTEYDGDTLRFPLGRRTDTCAVYCETIGFNTVQLARRVPLREGRWATGGIAVGYAHDGLTGFLQNEYSHGRAGAPRVPREGERRGLLFGAALEGNQGFRGRARPFAGLGLAAHNVYTELYLHGGLQGQRVPLLAPSFGFKYAATARAGWIGNGRRYVFGESRYFRDLADLHLTGQGEAGLWLVVRGIPLEFSWRGGYTTGLFVHPETGRPVGMFLEGLRTVIWKVAFERYNDALNGTDYGPTYGVRLTF